MGTLISRASMKSLHWGSSSVYQKLVRSLGRWTGRSSRSNNRSDLYMSDWPQKREVPASEEDHESQVGLSNVIQSFEKNVGEGGDGKVSSSAEPEDALKTIFVEHDIHQWASSRPES